LSVYYDLGVVGLAVMGQNLVLNIESKGYKVAVYNRSTDKVNDFISQRAAKKNIKGCYSLKELIESLSSPKKVMLMVKAGDPVDKVINSLIPLLKEEDIIIDGGNSHFKDTNRRMKKLEKQGIKYLGAGISGGEYGALHGPSIMPGGNKTAYKKIERIFIDSAAKTKEGPCVSYLGPNSAGHYVKMVHNGIEYGVMASISEAYDIMRKILNYNPEKMGSLFANWNESQESYLLEITADILVKEDELSENKLIDVILDSAQEKGTGKWSVQDAMELGIAIPSINAAVNSRYLSAAREDRQKINEEIGGIKKINYEEKYLKEILEDALFIGMLISYTEGLKLLEAASKEYSYDLNLAEIARIWQEGCIIRSNLLKAIQEVYKGKAPINLFFSNKFKNEVAEKMKALREVVKISKDIGLAIPALSSALDYYDIMRTKEMPANLIQAQRDYFGAHTYQRKDKEGIFHTEWQDIKNI